MTASSKPIFIVGCPRSGNTLLGCLLNKHPKLFILFEKKLFSGLHRKWRVEQRKNEAEPMCSFVRHANQSIRQQEVDLSVSLEELEARLDKGPVTFGTLLDCYMQVLISRFKPTATHWGDKSPQHTAHLQKVHRIYPQARILFIYRDPRHTVNSLSKTSFPHASNDPLVCAEVVRQYLSTYEEQKAKIPAESILEIRYEQLVREPESVLQRICAFIGIAYTERLLEPADEQTRQLFGWPNSKAWGRVTSQSSSTASQNDGLVEPYLADWIETFGYDRRKERFETVKRLLAEGYLTPFKFSARLLDTAYRFRYAKEETYLMQKWPQAQVVKHWFKR